MSEETKQKIRLANTGRKQSPEHVAKRLKNQSSWRPRPFTEEHRAKLRERMTGNLINLGRKQPREERLRRSELNKGEKCYLWKGGINPVNDSIRKSAEYKLWREAVFERDNWTCVQCSERSSAGNSVVLNADHIKPFAYFPELRFAIDNGRTLCVSCHRKTDTWGNRAKVNITIV